MKLSEHIVNILAEFDDKFSFYEIYVCADCGHNKESHYWNGGGREESSGYDRCRADGCECVSENWKIKKQKEENHELKSFLRQSLKSIAYKEKENAFDVLMSCMPKSAENINTITPEDARKMLQDFVKKYWYKDE